MKTNGELDFILELNYPLVHDFFKFQDFTAHIPDRKSFDFYHAMLITPERQRIWL